VNKIPEWRTPLEHFVVWNGGFTDAELDMVVAACELSEFNKGRVGGGMNQEANNANIRDTDITWVEQNDANAWIYQRMSALASRINADKFQFDLSHFQQLQYGKYKPGGHYTWHYDSGPNLLDHRKLSFVVALSDPNSYEGGELQINVTGDANAPHSMKIRKGDMIVFPSYVAHRVTPVTSGERMTMVGWVVGPKFK
jgi:PKHD-type hydroxylase